MQKYDEETLYQRSLNLFQTRELLVISSKFEIPLLSYIFYIHLRDYEYKIIYYPFVPSISMVTDWTLFQIVGTVIMYLLIESFYEDIQEMEDSGIRYFKFLHNKYYNFS